MYIYKFCAPRDRNKFNVCLQSLTSYVENNNYCFKLNNTVKNLLHYHFFRQPILD